MKTTKFVDIYLPTLICLFGTIIAIYFGATSGIKDITELKKIEVKAKSLIRHPQKSRQSEHFDLEVINYLNTFRIPPDYTGLLKHQKFYNQVKLNDHLDIWIKDKDSRMLRTNTTVLIYAIESKNEIYLDKNEVIAKSSLTRNVMTPIFGIVLTLLTIGIYLYRRHKYGK